MYVCMYVHSIMSNTSVRSQRRLGSKFMDLQIVQFPCTLVGVTGTPFTPVKIRWESCGLPRDNLFEIYTDSRGKVFGISAVVIV